jgi:hypothetical protein
VTRFVELDLVGVVDVAQELLRIAGDRALKRLHARCQEA